MMRLRAVRLVNWYHFTDETFPIQGSCILAGDNGSGKSTVLDAVQLALVANLTQVRFNEAANEHSQRNLHGYVLYKRGSETGDSSGRVAYGRQACTSYVVVYFSDDMDPSKHFSGGLVLEAHEHDTSVPKAFFVAQGKSPAELPLVGADGFVTSMKQFRPLLQLQGGKVWTDAGTYRNELRHRLGPVPDGFHRQIVNGLKFRQIRKVREFVHQYMLEANPLETGPLLANLENYKRMEAEAAEAKTRIAALTAILTARDKLVNEQRLAAQHSYLTVRAKEETAAQKVAASTQELEHIQGEKKRIAQESSAAEKEIEFWDQERNRVLQLMVQDPNFQSIEALKRDIERVERDLKDAIGDERRLLEIIDQHRGMLDRLSGQEAHDLRRAFPEAFVDEEIIGVQAPPPLLTRIKAALATGEDLAKRDLTLWTKRVAAIGKRIGRIAIDLQIQLGRLKAQGEQDEKELRELRKGKVTYRPEVEALLHLLRQKLRGARDPQPLCELIEVKNERWRNAIEGYLNTRRFDVLVAPEDFSKALGHYERNKQVYTLPGHGNISIHGVGLVDMERILTSRPVAQARSLAAQIETDDPLARAYCDYFLGDVITCDSEQELRRHGKSITDTVMVYQNYTARQTNPAVFRQHFIGKASQQRRIAELERELEAIAIEYQSAAKWKTWVDITDQACVSAAQTVAQITALQDSATAIPPLREQHEQLKRRLTQIDRGGLERLENERKDIEGRLENGRKSLLALNNQLGAIGISEKSANEQLANAQVEKDNYAIELREITLAVTGVEHFEERYRTERRNRSPEEIRAAFEPQLARAQKGIDAARLEARDLRIAYINRFGFAGDVNDDQATDYVNEQSLWVESRLPEYLEKIQRAKHEAVQQLTEDIVFKLRERLLSVRQIIHDMNRALKDVSFGSERYEFTLQENPEHAAFHKLILQAAYLENKSLAQVAETADAEGKKVVEELFERLTGHDVRAVEQELKTHADYREYYLYDIKILHANGSYSFYSKVLGDKSGGETQTPFYIAILASMRRLYAALSPIGSPSCGLILLDEAFSKMDEDRIAGILKLSRELKMQLLLATPKERLELISPHVETSLFIHRDAQSGDPEVFNFSKEFSAGAWQQA